MSTINIVVLNIKQPSTIFVTVQNTVLVYLCVTLTVRPTRFVNIQLVSLAPHHEVCELQF